MIKKSFTLSGHQTSIKLESEFWQALEAIALCQKKTLKELLEFEDRQRKSVNLASHLRVFVLAYVKAQMKDPL